MTLSRHNYSDLSPASRQKQRCICYRDRYKLYRSTGHNDSTQTTDTVTATVCRSMTW